MEFLINALYENLEESKLIQDGRSDIEKMVREFVRQFGGEEGEERENMCSKLYEMLGLAEKAGFSSGFRYGVNLMAECRIFPEIPR